MKNKKILLFILCLPVLLSLPYATQGQGIDISSGGNIAVTGTATIELNNQGFVNNGTYTKGTETIIFSGVTAKTISGSSNTDMYNLSVTNTGGITTQVGLLTTNNLTIALGSKFAIDPVKQVTVNGILTNAATSVIVIKSGATGTGSLIHSTAGVAGMVERYIAGWSDALHGWHFLSSPVVTQTITTDFHDYESLNNDFYKWDEFTNMWINRTATGYLLNTAFETEFAVGTGYLIASGNTNTPAFTGILNVGGVDITGLTMTGSQTYTGWHLLGNPYSSALSWNNGDWNLVNIAANCEIWDETIASYTPAIITPGNAIPAMNGFMVHADMASASLTIPASARVHSSQVWYKSAEQNSDMIVLIARDPVGKTAQRSVIRFADEATEGYDTQYDNYFLSGFAPLFYSVSQDAKYILNTLPEIDATTTIPMGFVKNANSQFTIELSQNIPGLSVYLTDQKTSLTQKLNDGGYTFTSVAGDNADRFLLNFLEATSVADPKQAKDFAVYASDGILNIQSLSQLGGKVMVTDMVGRTVATGHIEAGTTMQINIHRNTGVYIVSVLTAKGRSNTKIIVK